MKSKENNTALKHQSAVIFYSVIVLAVLAAYVNILYAPFIFDDMNHIHQNSRIHNLWPVARVLSSTNRPITDFTLALNYHIGRLSSFGYHLFNVVVHVFNALLIMLILKESFLSPRFSFKNHYEKHAAPLAFFIALLWAVHPIQTQSVTYIIQRSELLMGLFYLLTLFSVIRYHHRPQMIGWALAAVFFCALGMGSKEVMVTAPIVILIYDRIFLARSFKEMWEKRGRVYLGLAATWLLLFKFATTERANAAIGGFSFDLVSPWQYAVSQPKVICHYLRLMFWPQGQCLDYLWPLAQTISDVLPYSIVILGGLVLTGWALRFRPALGFLGIWFFFILAPTSSFMPIGDLVFEHRMYLSSLSVITLFVLLADYSVKKFCERRYVFWRTGFFILLTLILMTVTIMRNRVYRDDETLWRDVLKKRPENMRAYQNLGVALNRKGKRGEAQKYIQKALELNPINGKAYYNLAVTYEEEGAFPEALRNLKESIRLNPDFVYAYLLSGRIYIEMKDYVSARTFLKKALLLDAENAAGIFYWGVLLFQEGDVDGALQQYDAALALNPQDPQVYYHAALALAQKGEVSRAEDYFRRVLAFNPDNALAHFNLGNLLAQRGRYSDAARHFEACRELKPDFAPVRQRLQQLQVLLP